MLPLSLIIVLFISKPCVTDDTPTILKDHVLKAPKVQGDFNQIANAMEGISTTWKNIKAKIPDAATSVAGFVNGYGRVMAIGAVITNYRAGNTDGAFREIVELTLAMAFLDIPQAFSLPIDILYPIISDHIDDVMKPVKAVITKMHVGITDKVKQKFGESLKQAGTVVADAMEEIGAEVSSKLQKAKAPLMKALDTALNSKLGELAKKGFEKAGAFLRYSGLKEIVKFSFVMEFFNIGYCTMDLVRGAKKGDIDSVVINAIGIAGSIVGLFASVAAYASAGSIAGPIGVAIGTILGVISCFLGFMKPDPEEAIQASLKIHNELAQASIESLGSEYHYTKFMDIKGLEFNWIAECNQGSMSDINGITPKEANVFNVAGGFNNVRDKKLCPFQKELKDETCWYQPDHTKVFDASIGHGWFYTLEGKRVPTYPGDFYIIRKRNKYSGNVVVYLRADQASKNYNQLGAKVLFTEPAGYGKPSNDAVYVGNMPKIPIKSEAIAISFGKGQDVIEVSGIIGAWQTANDYYKDILSIKYGDDVNDDTISFYDMVSNQEHLENTEGLEGLSLFKEHGEHIYICYQKGRRHDQRLKTYCPIRLGHLPSILITSPLEDEVYLAGRGQMEIRNRIGRNSYTVHIEKDELIKYRTSNEKNSYNILDNTTDSRTPKLTFSAWTSTTIDPKVEITYCDLGKFFHVYGRVNGDISLLRRIYFASSIQVPRQIIISQTIKPKNGALTLDEIDRIPSTVKDETPKSIANDADYTYTFNQKLVSRRNQAADTVTKTCFCAPRADKEEYHIVDMGDGVDIITIARNLYLEASSSSIYGFNRKENIMMNLVWMKTSVNPDAEDEDTYEWVFQYRTLADNLKTMQRPHLDVILRNVELVTFQRWEENQRELIVDLTDAESVTPNIDLVALNKRLKTVEIGRSNDNLVFTDGDDIVLIVPGERNDMHQEEIDVKGGNDVVVIRESVQYMIQKHDDGSMTLYLTHPHYNHEIKVENVDRVVCQHFGITRTLPDWKNEVEVTNYKDLHAKDCVAEAEETLPFSSNAEMNEEKLKNLQSCSC